MENTSTNCLIGAGITTSGNKGDFFDGKMGFVNIEKRELTPTEVFKLHKYLKGAYNL